MDQFPDGPVLAAWEHRLATAAASMIGELSPDQLDECQLLAQLEPGTFVSIGPDGETCEVRWSGAVIGYVSRTWLLTGHAPDGWEPELRREVGGA